MCTQVNLEFCKGKKEEEVKVEDFTPRWILLSTPAISKQPSSENAAFHLLGLRVLPTYEIVCERKVHDESRKGDGNKNLTKKGKIIGEILSVT